MNKDCEHTIGIKIDDSEVEAKVLYCIKKTTSLSLSVLKQKISEHEYLMLIDAADLDDIKRINAFKRELSKLGVKITMYLNDREKDPEYFENWEQSCIEIDQEYDDFDY